MANNNDYHPYFNQVKRRQPSEKVLQGFKSFDNKFRQIESKARLNLIQHDVKYSPVSFKARFIARQ